MSLLRNGQLGAMRHERTKRAVVALILVAGVELGASLGNPAPVARAATYHTYTCALDGCPHRSLGARPGSSHLFKLTLIVPRRTYPAGAVIQVTARVQNISRQSIHIYYGPSVLVVRRDGTAYPPPFSDQPSQGLFYIGYQLGPGRVMQRQKYVILRSAILEPYVQYLLAAPLKTATGPRLTLRLIHEPRPTIKLSGPPRLQAKLRSPVAVTGPLLWTDSYVCLDQYGTEDFASSGWNKTWGATIRPSECRGRGERVLQWHVLAGWLGHPLGRVDYRVGGR